eukprot:1212413-Pleurochrysis_carterae.AAC.2
MTRSSSTITSEEASKSQNQHQNRRISIKIVVMIKIAIAITISIQTITIAVMIKIEIVLTTTIQTLTIAMTKAISSGSPRRARRVRSAPMAQGLSLEGRAKKERMAEVKRCLSRWGGLLARFIQSDADQAQP